MLRAVPFGLVFLLGTYLSLRRRQSGRARSTQDFPEFARSQGLQHQPARDAAGAGRLSGNYHGYELRVDPDEEARIVLRFAGAPQISLRTFGYHKRPPSNWKPIITRYRRFDAHFKERYATPQVAQRLDALGDLDTALQRLEQCPQPISSLSISSDGIECRLKIQRISYISVETLSYLLPLLLTWAQALDPLQPQASPARAAN